MAGTRGIEGDFGMHKASFRPLETGGGGGGLEKALLAREGGRKREGPVES